MTGLYIHIPFCASKCGYCDFYSETGMMHRMDAYIDAVLEEASGFRSIKIKTLYVGGGTPSSIGGKKLIRLIGGLKEIFNFSMLDESTIELNPDSANYEFIKSVQLAGFNRLSIGVQSLNDDELKSCGRIHNSKQASLSIEAALKTGFTNISADIIVGLPGQTLLSLRNTLNALIAQGVVHVSAYCLSIEQGTMFSMHPPENLPDDNMQVDLFTHADSILSENRFVHYEISNFALKGMECKHNINYWTGGSYIGLGAAAASHIDGRRYKNVANIERYIETPRAAIEEEEYLQPEQKIVEEAILRLRLLDEGLNLSELWQKYPADAVNELKIKLDVLVKKDRLIKEYTNYMLPDSLVMLANTVFLQILS